MRGLPACSSNEDGEACGWGGLGEMGSAGFVCLFPCDLEEKEWFPNKTLNIPLSCTVIESSFAIRHILKITYRVGKFIVFPFVHTPDQTPQPTNSDAVAIYT